MNRIRRSILIPALALATVAAAYAGGVGSDARLVHPNPFTESCTFTLNMPSEGSVRILVYDMLGRQVADLTERMQKWEFAAGTHEIPWDGEDETGEEVPAGTYVCVLWTADGEMVNSVKVVKAGGPTHR